MIKLNPVLVNQVTAPHSTGRVTGILEVAMETALASCFLPETPAYLRIMCNFIFSSFLEAGSILPGSNRQLFSEPWAPLLPGHTGYTTFL